MAKYLSPSRIWYSVIQPFILMEEGAHPSPRDEKQSEGGLEDLSCPWVRAKQTLLNNRLQFASYTSSFSRWSEKWQGNCFISLNLEHVLLCWNFGPCFNIYNRGRRNEALFCCNFPMSFLLKYIGFSHPFFLMPNQGTAILPWALWAILSKLHSNSWLHLELGLTLGPPGLIPTKIIVLWLPKFPMQFRCKNKLSLTQAL